jgi:hypothetical protein
LTYSQQKLRWLRQMYKDAKKAEAPAEGKKKKDQEETKETPFDDPEWENLDKVAAMKWSS